VAKQVRGGADLSAALEQSASSSASPYYRRIAWQIANANRAGAEISTVLKDIVDYLSEEQKIMIRNYGSQLSPLSLFYMLSCIIMPTMGLIFLAISSTITNIPVSEATLLPIFAFIVLAQIMFIGLIKSRRPAVAI
jgi:pilus assembly protein TadC